MAAKAAIGLKGLTTEKADRDPPLPKILENTRHEFYLIST